MRYLFFLDFDGTICDIATNSVHFRTLQGIAKARAAGHLVFLNTGRSLAGIPPYALDALGLDGVVAGVGAMAKIGEKTLFSKRLSADDCRSALHIAHTHRLRLTLEGENFSLSLNGGHPLLPSIILDKPDDFEKYAETVRVSKLTFHAHLTEQMLAELSPQLVVLNLNSRCEVAPEGCGKGTGMHLVKQYLPADDYITVAMGDSGNDTAMLKAADISVAMGNAPDEIKQMADIVSCSCTEGGVGEAIEHVLNMDIKKER